MLGTDPEPDTKEEEKESYKVLHQLEFNSFREQAQQTLKMKAQQMALPSVEEQAAIQHRPDNVDTWTYQNINSVFHNPDGLELSDKEKIEKAKKVEKKV